MSFASVSARVDVPPAGEQMVWGAPVYRLGSATCDAAEVVAAGGAVFEVVGLPGAEAPDLVVGPRVRPSSLRSPSARPGEVSGSAGCARSGCNPVELSVHLAEETHDDVKLSGCEFATGCLGGLCEGPEVLACRGAAGLRVEHVHHAPVV